MSSRYRPLNEYAAPRFRLAPQGLRDELIAMAVDEFPDMPRASRDEIVSALQENMRRTVKRRYGSLLATFLIGLVINVIARIVVDWWFDHDGHKTLMKCWKNALART